MREDNFLVEEELKREGDPSEAEPAGSQPLASAAIIVPEAEAQASISVEEVHPEGPAGEAVSPLSAARPYHERYYLKYREGKRSAELDLDGTKKVLQMLGFDGGELRQAREGKNRAESFRNADKNRSNQMFCSYCGMEISGVEFNRLANGRARCTSCSSTLVKTKAEAEELCRRVIENMESFFGAVLEVPISVEIVDERKLRKKLGGQLDKKDMQSTLVLGAAVEEKKKYRIILQNGAPRIATIATFAHELTHIWQYVHWNRNRNVQKCPRRKRLLIYEGMAKWAEIQYLYLIGEANVAKREEYITRNRQDEYGVGFCLYEAQYPLSRGAMSCEDTPFTPDGYPAI